MPVVDLPLAKSHLRLASDYPDEQVAVYLGAAVRAAAEFLNRRIFADQAELDAGRAGITAALIAAGEAYQAALDAVDSIDDQVARCAAQLDARRVYDQAQVSAVETQRGIVVNDQIKAAILLLLGHLFENRQEVQQGIVAQLPVGAHSLLFPFRVGLGV